MTFVAQPYEQFADDLLTALTGGVIREEHQFVGVDEAYTLASPDVMPDSLKVFGQVNTRFTLFEEDIDYEFDAQDEAIAWLSNSGVRPDDRSYFYINYYREEGQRRLTDRNPGSVTTTLAEAFGRELAVLHKQMELIYQSAFVDLAAGASLEHVAALLGLKRKDARYASGEILFTRTTPAPGDIAISVGTLVSTGEGQNFEVTTKRTLRRGQLSVKAPIRAQVEGPAGQVSKDLIQNLNRPIFGIEAVTNEKPTFFATTKETDEELRRRIKGTVERAGRSTLVAIKYGLIESVTEVTEDNIQVTERAEAPGYVEVKLGLASFELASSDEKADLVRRVEEAILASRPAGIRVSHNLPTRTDSAAKKKIAAEQTPASQNGATGAAPVVKAGATISPTVDELSGMSEGIFALQAEVQLELAEKNLSAAQKESIEDDVRQRIVRYVKGIPMGEPVIYSKVLAQAVQDEEILDAVVYIGTSSKPRQKWSNLATNGRKATIDLSQVDVSLMRETVFIDVLVTLASNNDATQVGASERTVLETAVEEAVQEDSKHKKVLKTKIREKVAKLLKEPGASLFSLGSEYVAELTAGQVSPNLNKAFQAHGKPLSSQARIMAAMVQDRWTVIDAGRRYVIRSENEALTVYQVIDFHLPPSGGITLNALYEDTGRQLVDTEKVLLEDHHRAELRQVRIEVPGALDGQS
jgi:uncharacterized phage protein gp47/JayE